jgi:hypothetical protein
LKNIRSFGSVEKRDTGKFRARFTDSDSKISLGQFDTKEEAERALKEYMEKNGIIQVEEVEDVVGQSSKPFVEMTQDTAEISTGVVDKPITDWDSILLSFGLDPAIFEIANDKVRMSKWQSSKRLENGDRDLIWLYSYKATFMRRKTPAITKDDIAEIRASIRAFKPSKQASKVVDSTPATFVVLWADWQLAKSASGGVKATVKRVLDSFEKTSKRVKELQKTGRNIEQIAFVNMGDPVEGCDGHYASQLFSVEQTQRQQLLTALDLWTTGVTSLSDLAEKTKFISTLSNHGEWMRRGNKSVTTDSDSADGFLADALKRILDGYNLVDGWHIPHDQMTMQVNLSGIECAFTHGHKIAGKELEWLRAQSLRLLRDNGSEPRMWFTAHKHHIKIDDFGAFTRFQCPSLDTDGSTSGGSKWYTDISGVWSSPGTMTLLVGQHDKKGWSDLAVL